MKKLFYFEKPGRRSIKRIRYGQADEESLPTVEDHRYHPLPLNTEEWGM